MQTKQYLTAFLHSKGFQILLVTFAILAFLPIFVTDSFFLYILTLIFVFAIYAASWNFLASSGQGSLGHALFLGIGGFSSAIVGGRISIALIGLLGVEKVPIGALSVLIQVLVLLVGGVVSAGIGLLIGSAVVQ